MNALEQLTAPLLAWYRANARSLPWRESPDAYRVWVSEIMLQQTRVAAVLGYYTRFLAEFPTVEALAAADEGRLMKLWEGLGYYSRARNLRKAAGIVAEQYGGRFPETYEELTALPGIGDYTAGAILSIAFGKPVPAVDGNVLRVVSRITDCHGDILSPAVKKAIRRQVEAIMPASEPDIRIFNQAAMELGATVCVPNGPPQCRACPAFSFCLGRIRGTAEALPVKAPKKQRRAEEKTVFVLLSPEGTALRRRLDSGLLAGLWEFPNVEGTLKETEAAALAAQWGLEIAQWDQRLTAKHIFTHVEWRMTGYVLHVRGRDSQGFVWADLQSLRELAVPSAFGRFLEEAQAALKRES